jgi:hypothetical protein
MKIIIAGAGEVGSKAFGGDDKGKKKGGNAPETQDRQIARSAGQFMNQLVQNNGAQGVRTAITNGGLNWGLSEAMRNFAEWVDNGMETAVTPREQLDVFQAIQARI